MLKAGNTMVVQEGHPFACKLRKQNTKSIWDLGSLLAARTPSVLASATPLQTSRCVHYRASRRDSAMRQPPVSGSPSTLRGTFVYGIMYCYFLAIDFCMHCRLRHSGLAATLQCGWGVVCTHCPRSSCVVVRCQRK